MKRQTYYKSVIVLLITAIFFAGSSCSKGSASRKPPVVGEKKAAAQLTPEQRRQVEEMKKGVREAKTLVIARVNGADISMYSLVREMNLVAPKYIGPGQRTTPEMDERIKKEALDRLIFDELAVQEARKQGITVRPEAIDGIISKVRENHGSESAFREYLEMRGLSEDELRSTIERGHLFEMITAREIYGGIKVDEKALRERYGKEKGNLMTKGNPPKQPTFEEAKGLIEQKIIAEEGARKMAAWEKELKKKARIEILLAKVEKDLKEKAAKKQ